MRVVGRHRWGAGLLVAVLVACGGVAGGSLPEDEWNRVLEEMRPDWEPREVETFLTRCLDEGGVTFDYTIRASHSGYGYSGQGVSEADAAVAQSCMREAEERFPASPPTSPEQLSVTYDLLVRMADCLEEQGVDVDRPSREAFIDSEGKWTPYQAVGPEEYERLEQACPQDKYAYVGD